MNYYYSSMQSNEQAVKHCLLAVFTVHRCKSQQLQLFVQNIIIHCTRVVCNNTQALTVIRPVFPFGNIRFQLKLRKHADGLRLIRIDIPQNVNSSAEYRLTKVHIICASQIELIVYL